ncbi:MAG: creatininase family protein, partial [bacterium]|nr:creatininase family protein [bacterium]
MKKQLIIFSVFIFIFAVLIYFFNTRNQAGIELQYLTWQEVEKVFEDHDTVVIPLGAITKEHGPHLPLNNDYIMAEYLAQRIVKELDTAMMPTVPFGFYPSFLEYPGSVSLQPETFKNLIKDICGSIAGYGIKKFYIINTGVTTARVLALVKQELFEESGIVLEYTDIIKAGQDAVHEVETQEGGTHADEIETSMMLYIKPDIVDMKKAVKDYDPRDLRGLTRDRSKPHTYSPTG